jgi:N12 class adenine-specific DNA methylase
MNPQKRFGQLEEIMAEMLQKQDRLETLAVQTFEVAFNADTKVETLNEKVDALDEKLTAKIDSVDEKQTTRIDTVARAVADLTVDNQREHQQLNDKLDGIMAYLKEKLG